MSDKKKDDSKSDDERRKMARFAWLGPLLERRKEVGDALDGSEDAGEELEEMKD